MLLPLNGAAALLHLIPATAACSRPRPPCEISRDIRAYLSYKNASCVLQIQNVCAEFVTKSAYLFVHVFPRVKLR